MVITKFIYELILTRFGCTFILVSDQNIHFINHAIEIFTNHFPIMKHNLDHLLCHNPSLGLATKVRACKGAGQE